MTTSLTASLEPENHAQAIVPSASSAMEAAWDEEPVFGKKERVSTSDNPLLQDSARLTTSWLDKVAGVKEARQTAKNSAKTKRK